MNDSRVQCCNCIYYNLIEGKEYCTSALVKIELSEQFKICQYDSFYDVERDKNYIPNLLEDDPDNPPMSLLELIGEDGLELIERISKNNHQYIEIKK